MIAVESATVGRSGAWAVGLSLDYSLDPLVVRRAGEMVEPDRPVTTRTTTVLLLSYAFKDRFEAGLALPVVQQSGEDPQFSGIAPADGTALGAAALHGKIRLFDDGRLALASSASVTLPTASSGQFVGTKLPNGHLRGIAGLRLGPVNLAVNAGFRLRAMGTLGDADQGNEVTFGVAGEYRVLDSLSAMGEVFGARGLGASDAAPVTPLELLAGVRYRLTRQLALSAGAGRGVLGGIGEPKFRAFVQVSFSPGSREIQPVVPPVPIDRGDDDNDGFINSEDQCPTRSEDRDGFSDEDGCPDPDNDEDGILDGNDQCPNQREDLDQFEDSDGCPELDNDDDGVEDEKDRCPNEAEDIDQFEDEDGCPELDNDGDGIPDATDQCVDKPETINGNQDNDGCPDAGDSLVLVMADRIEMFRPIEFRGNSAKLLKKSDNVLGQIAATLRAHPEFIKVRIVVHVQRSRNKKADQTKSTRRARAIRDWLIKWGIDRKRLSVKGEGSDKMLVPRKQKNAKKINERVELIILEKDVKSDRTR